MDSNRSSIQALILLGVLVFQEACSQVPTPAHGPQPHHVVRILLFDSASGDPLLAGNVVVRTRALPHLEQVVFSGSPSLLSEGIILEPGHYYLYFHSETTEGLAGWNTRRFVVDDATLNFNFGLFLERTELIVKFSVKSKASALRITCWYEVDGSFVLDQDSIVEQFLTRSGDHEVRVMVPVGSSLHVFGDVIAYESQLCSVTLLQFLGPIPDCGHLQLRPLETNIELAVPEASAPLLLVVSRQPTSGYDRFECSATLHSIYIHDLWASPIQARTQKVYIQGLPQGRYLLNVWDGIESNTQSEVREVR